MVFMWNLCGFTAVFMWFSDFHVVFLSFSDRFPVVFMWGDVWENVQELTGTHGHMGTKEKEI